MNNEQLLQLTKHLGVDGDDGVFESAYKLDGLQILPPLMTEIKRLQMQQYRLQAMTRELARKRSNLPLVEKQLKSLMPVMVNASTNTVLPVQSPGPVSTSAPMVVMGRFRQNLQRSETAVHDYSDIRLTPLAPAKALPTLEATHMVIKQDAPQRALIKITPIVLGTLKSSWISKLGLCRPLQRCTTSIELRELHRQERVPGRPVVFPSSTQIPKTLPNTSQGRFRSQIPRIQRSTVQPKVQAPVPGVIPPGHVSCYEPNAVKTDSANERRRHYGAKVALKRNEMAKKREELAKLKPKPRTNNSQVPISIRTPIRRVEAGEFQESKQLHLKHEQQQGSVTRVEGTELLEPQMLQQKSRPQSVTLRQEGSAKTNNNIQVIKSIRTPIRRMEAGSEDPDLQQQRNRVLSLPVSRQELPSPRNSQVQKIIRTPIMRVEGAELLEPELLQKNRSQSLISRQEHEQQQGSVKTNNNIQAPKSIRTPIRRVEEASEDPDLQQQRNRVQSLPFSRQELEQRRLQIQELPYPGNKIIRTPIRWVEGAELLEPELLLQNRPQSLVSRQEHEQQQGSGSVKTNSNTPQVPKSVKRVEGADLLEPELLQKKHRIQLLISRQEHEQQRLQVQLEQQQQGLINQMVGNIATVDSRDTTSELVADPEQHPLSVPDPHQA